MSTLTPERCIEIHTLLQELSDYWHDHPELRFGQIVSDFSTVAPDDAFYVPDGHFIWKLAAENKLTAFGADMDITV